MSGGSVIRTSLCVAALLALMLSGLIPVSPQAGRTPAASDAFSSAAARLEAASLAGKVDAIKMERLNILRMLAGTPAADRVGIMRYTVAYAAWRVAFAPDLPAAEQTSLLDDAAVQ